MNVWVEYLDKYSIDDLLKFLSDNKESLDFFNPHPFTRDALEKILNSSREDKYLLLYKDNVVIGYGLLRGWDEGYSVPSLGIQIDKDHRGEGWGKHLMRVLHQIAKDEGALKVRLTVMKDNIIARSMYERLGYKFHSYKEDRDEGILYL